MCIKIFIFFPAIAFMLIIVACVNGPVRNTGGLGVAGGTLKVEISASASCAKQGDTIHLRAVLTNSTSSTQIFEIQNKPVFDIGISVGNLRTKWSDGKTMTPDLTRLEFKPGESKTIEMDWIVTTPGSGNVGAIFTYGNGTGDVTGANVPLNVEPYCPGIGP